MITIGEKLTKASNIFNITDEPAVYELWDMCNEIEELLVKHDINVTLENQKAIVKFLLEVLE